MQGHYHKIINRELLDVARSYNLELLTKFIKKTKGPLGYIRLPNSIGNLESRDIMMCTFLFGKLGREHDNIVEIGGGFGNCVRICENIVKFKKWTIIDLPHVTNLQKQFLKKELEDYSKIEFVDTNAYPEWKNNFKGADLVLGSFSLSEFNYSTFKDYYDNIIKESKYLFWAEDKEFSEESIDLKLKDINNDFSLIENLRTENQKVTNTIFKK